MEHILTGCLQRGHGAAVEGVAQGDDGAAVLSVAVKAVFAGCFDHALVCLCARVPEENLLRAREGAELLGRRTAGLAVKEVGGVGKRRCLIGYGARPVGVSIAERRNADAACKVDLLSPVGAEQTRARTLDKGNGMAGVGPGQIPVIPLLDL